MPDHLDDMDLAALTREAERLGYVRMPGPGPLLVWLAAAAAWLLVGDDRRWWSAAGRPLFADEAAALRWLLRQPEALARAACYARGVADEHAATVTLLRAALAAYRGDKATRADELAADLLRDVLAGAHRGDHEAGR